MKTVLIGLGNPILGDDGIGLEIAMRLKEIFPSMKLILSSSLELDLLEEIKDFDICFVIDAVIKEDNEGRVFKFKDDNLSDWRYIFSSHGIDIFSLFSLGRKLGYKIPKLIEIYGISIGKEIYIDNKLSETFQKNLPYLID